MTQVARLTADLYTNTSSFESGFKRANNIVGQFKSQTGSALAQAGRSFDNFNTHVQRSIGGIGDLKTQLGGLATSVAGALSVQKIVQYSDMWKQTSSRLSLVTKDAQELARVQESLFRISQNNSSPLGDTIDAYVRLGNSLSDVQKEQYDLLTITDLLSKTLKISGANAAGAATFLQQFGQAASSDFKAIGQELQTFADQNPRFYGIIRAEAEKSGQTLKEFAKEGGLSFDFVAKALTNAAGQINEDAQKINLTVSQSLIQLDNAFLKFIGQSAMVANGTTSVAAGISALAENFGYLASAVTSVAVVFGARYVSALVLAGTTAVQAFTRTTLSAAAMNTALTVSMTRVAGLGATVSYSAVALNTMSLSARAAAISMGLLSGATTALGAAMAFVGGPLGVAVIGALAMVQLQSMNAAKAQQEMNLRLEEHRDAAQEYIYANEERRKAIVESTRSNIQSMKLELEAQRELLNAYNDKSFIGRFAANLGLPGAGDGFKDIVRKGAALENGVSELEAIMAQMDAMNRAGAGGGLGGGTGSGTKKKDAYKEALDALKQESAQLDLQVQMYGEKESAIERAQQAQKIQNQLAAAGVKITKEQQAEIDKYLDSIQKQTELQKEQQEQQERLQELERDREQALNQLGATFSSAFEKAITDGEKLSDVLSGLLDDIVKLVARVTITEPLGNFITQTVKGSTGGGGFLSGLFDWLPSFDVGTNYVPHDMVAQIHRGEAIVPAYDAAKLRSGGGNVNINVVNNAGAKVSTQATEGADGTDIMVMIDQAVADNMTRRGSRTNQAMGAYNSRTLVRRG